MHLFLHRRWVWIWTVVTVLACGVNLWNNLVYLPGGPTPAFLLEKAAPPDALARAAGELASPTRLVSYSTTWEADLSPAALRREPVHATWWLTAFYIHVVSASVCLLTGLLLCFPAMLRYRRVHHVLGYVYVNSVLWAAAPTGLLMAPLAKGGMLSAIGFAVAAVAWWWTTWVGLQAILRNDLHRHVTAMTRSYALALSAPAFRVIQAALSPTSLSTDTIYIASLWLSLLVSLWLSESWTRSGGLSNLHREIPKAVRA